MAFQTSMKRRERLFGVADEEEVEEVRERLGVERTGAAGDDQRPTAAFAVGAAARNAGDVEHPEDRRVADLVLEGEADDVEVAYGQLRLEREERQAGAAMCSSMSRAGIKARSQRASERALTRP